MLTFGLHLNQIILLWHCLLFSENENRCNSIGYDNLKKVHHALLNCGISKEHRHLTLRFRLFDKQNITEYIILISIQ